MQIARWARPHCTALVGVLLNCLTPVSQAATAPSDLGTLSLEELANIQVISVSKKAEPLADAAASVFVITADDIRRSGVSRLPDALRLAPNLHVAQASANGYAISARGLNGSNTSAPNKMLVLIDGRSVYTPLFSGVFWDVQDVMLEDVERIEVISGPAGTLWGVNAVNGVINIITRPAKDTQGTLAAAGKGNREENASLRHGGKIGADGNYRIYLNYADRKNTSLENGNPVNDASHKTQAGFRTDWASARNQLTVEGNVYQGAQEQPAPGSIVIPGPNLALGDIRVSGFNLLSHWTHRLDGGASVNVQAYYDRTKRAIPPFFAETLDIADVQFQHALKPLGAHAIVWGANYRYSMDRVTNSDFFAFLPANLNQRWASLFAQDEITLRDDLKLTLGARMERNDYTGTEFLPSARLAWKTTPTSLAWAAASRTVRAPSRLDRDAYVPGRPPFLLDGGSNVVSEVAKVFEIGYRGQPTSRLSYSLTLFHNRYDDLRTQELAPSQTFVFFGNQMEGKASGMEIWGTWQASRQWRLSGGLTMLRERLRLKPGSIDVAAVNATGLDPGYRAMLRASVDLSSTSELDMIVRHVDALSSPTVPEYTTVDLRYGWKVRPDLEFSVTAQNLLGGGHAEYGDATTRSEFDRSLFVKLVSRF
ncbi:TonB-dependent receptor [Janthinobacterium sp. 17J80-10]|uniref:TonB-dependent receptor plug domain-containing protein n=1 Tax=Janthinobacterium sp. 17J80-10 TaxID=2497863 RepID=UPI001F514AEF|nr:TonB-dependent receptor [Janthinobacterium sp. 17J80-10]